MKAELVFSAPPTSGSKRRVLSVLGPALDALRDQPGEWALIASYESRAGAWYVPTALERAGVTDFDFEIRSSKAENQSWVWARYTGKAKAA